MQSRAEFICRNKRVRPQKRLRKRKTAVWLGLWLEAPGILETWLALRKKTKEVRELLQSECP
jgi:hypothetical protein